MTKKSLKKAEAHYPEVTEIKEDLASLKGNVSDLARHAGQDTKAQAEVVKKGFFESLTQLKIFGKNQAHEVEDIVKEHPAKSVAAAFAAGLVTSVIFGRK